MLATRRPVRSTFLLAAMCAASLGLPASVGMAADLSDAALIQDAAPEQASIVSPPSREPDAAEVECMAKVVLHEAGGEPHDGQVAVAQTLVNRLGAGRFGGSICEVANQRGQFFNTASYNPDRASDKWLGAAQVARAVLLGSEDQVAPGAIFFRAAQSSASGFFRSRQRVASVGAQIFYR